MLKEFGYVRVAAISNELEIANPVKNVEIIKELINKAVNNGVDIAVFPELCICGYTCQDLFLNDDLYNNCMKALQVLKNYSKGLEIVFIVGCILKVKNSLYNCAFSFYNGEIIGITPKTYIPNYNEFYEARYFNSASSLDVNEINIFNSNVKISNKLLYKCNNMDVCYAIDICEDLWMVNAPSNYTTLGGANIIFNLSSSNETIGKANYRKELVKLQSSKALCAYVYCSSGVWESTSDLVFSGACLICEPNGEMTLSDRFSLTSQMIISDIDIFRINSDRKKQRTYEMVPYSDFVYTYYSLSKKNNQLLKKYSKKPFLNHDDSTLEEILNIQSFALAKRIKFLNNCKMVIGISGGSDSTLAFLICLRACKILNLPTSNIIAITMPGFGTTSRTYTNAKNLILASKATYKEISIKDACILHFKDINHDDNLFDVTYENSQARERTQILFDIANKEGGIVVGTGDLSELALGWATYNGDHMANYGVNSSIPKTLITTLIAYIKDHEDEPIKSILNDILNTPISPELLPPDDDGNISQITEKAVGPYVLHDFFLYHFLRYGASVKKIYFLACQTFDEYSKDEIKRVLKIFIRRFFQQQFKRNCLCDGIKVGSIAVSPRGDLRLSSDVSASMYLKELENL